MPVIVVKHWNYNITRILQKTSFRGDNSFAEGRIKNAPCQTMAVYQPLPAKCLLHNISKAGLFSFTCVCVGSSLTEYALHSDNTLSVEMFS